MWLPCRVRRWLRVWRFVPGMCRSNANMSYTSVRERGQNQSEHSQAMPWTRASRPWPQGRNLSRGCGVCAARRGQGWGPELG